MKKRRRGHREWAAIFASRGKPHTTYNPGTGQMEPEDYALYQRQAPTHVFPDKKSKTGLTKPIEISPRKLVELRHRAEQQFGESPRRSSSGKFYWTDRKDIKKKIQQIEMARERKLQQRLAKRSGTLRQSEDTDIEIPVSKRFRVERPKIESVSDTVRYDPQEVALLKGGSMRPSVIVPRGGSPLKDFKGKSPNPTRISRATDSEAIRYRWKDIIKARKEGGVRITGKVPLKSGISSSEVGRRVVSTSKAKLDPIELIRTRKEKETARLRRKALRMHVQKLGQNVKKIRQERKLLEKRIARKDRQRVKIAQKTKRQSRLRTFLSKLISVGGRRQNIYFKELDDPKYRRRHGR